MEKKPILKQLYIALRHGLCMIGPGGVWQPYPTNSRLAKGSAARIGVDARFLEDQVHSKMHTLKLLVFRVALSYLKSKKMVFHVPGILY